MSCRHPTTFFFFLIADVLPGALPFSPTLATSQAWCVAHLGNSFHLVSYIDVSVS
jgi:hypothetical protein